MLWFVENFFCYRGQNFHEIGIYYYIKMLDENALYKGDEIFFGKEKERDLLYQWFPLKKLHEVSLYPIFLRESLQKLPPHPQFLTVREETFA